MFASFNWVQITHKKPAPGFVSMQLIKVYFIALNVTKCFSQSVQSLWSEHRSLWQLSWTSWGYSWSASWWVACSAVLCCGRRSSSPRERWCLSPGERRRHHWALLLVPGELQLLDTAPWAQGRRWGHLLESIWALSQDLISGVILAWRPLALELVPWVLGVLDSFLIRSKQSWKWRWRIFVFRFENEEMKMLSAILKFDCALCDKFFCHIQCNAMSSVHFVAKFSCHNCDKAFETKPGAGFLCVIWTQLKDANLALESPCPHSFLSRTPWLVLIYA